MILACSQTLYEKENIPTSVYRLKQFKTFIFLSQNRGGGGAWTKREKTLGFTHTPSPPRIINGLLAFAFAFVYKRDQWKLFHRKKKKQKGKGGYYYYSKLFNTDNAVRLNQQLKLPEKSLVLLRSHWTLKNALPPDEYWELIRSATTEVISKFCRSTFFCLHAS